MKKVRWGVLGTANIALTQVIPAILRSSNAEIVGIASRGIQSKDLLTKFSIPKYYESYESLLQSEEIESVYIPLPNHLHKEWVIQAAKYGKHILCEKPASLTAEESKEIADICGRNQVKFMEAFMYQFHPQHQRVRDIIESGEIGELKYMRASFSFFLENRDSNIRMRKEMGGGSIYDIGCYGIHSIRNILKSEPAQVKVFAEKDRQSGVDTSAIVHLRLENGVNAVIECSMDMDFRHEYEIVGTKGHLKVPRAFRPDATDGEGLIIVHSGQGFRMEKIVGDQYKNQIEHFSRAILEDFEPFYSIENTIQNMRIIDACYQSIEQQSTVRVNG
ncbi:Gfo/Idh/MocA family protein [Neobacillus muris]|uniref:Gfo/Idh/MocA family protein n=1 Tax=Neobacillus muris TaxID=2941334 RepID=UPI00203E56BE|nr:Gfo/Idh/MocA family oxidoreductase [Neobacillus muris]